MSISYTAIFILLISAFYLGSCKRHSRSTSAPVSSSSSVPSVEYEAGDYDAEGRIVVFAVGMEYRFLESDAALVFRNVGTSLKPKAGYDLTTRTEGHKAYSSLSELMEALSNMPKPRVVDFYTTCGAPPWFELPEKQVDDFFDEMKKAGVELRETSPSGVSNVICTCP